MKIRTSLIVGVAGVIIAIGAPNGAMAGINLVSNGSFETGDFTGWTQFGDTTSTGVTGSFAGFDPTDGSSQGVFGPTLGLGGITQTLSSANTFYNVSFDLGNGGGTPNSFNASFGGNSLLTFNNAGGFPYTHYDFTTVAGGPNPTLQFTFFQSPSWYFVDNVSVTASTTPEPGFYGALALGFVGLAFARKRLANRAN